MSGEKSTTAGCRSQHAKQYNGQLPAMQQPFFKEFSPAHLAIEVTGTRIPHDKPHGGQRLAVGGTGDPSEDIATTLAANRHFNSASTGGLRSISGGRVPSASKTLRHPPAEQGIAMAQRVPAYSAGPRSGSADMEPLENCFKKIVASEEENGEKAFFTPTNA